MPSKSDFSVFGSRIISQNPDVKFESLWKSCLKANMFILLDLFCRFRSIFLVSLVTLSLYFILMKCYLTRIRIWPCANSWRFTIKRHWLIDCRWAYPLFHRRCESTKGWSLRKSQTPQFTKTPTWSWAGHGDMSLPPRPHHQSSTYTTTLKQLSTSLQQPSSHLSTTSHSTQQKLSSVPL